MGGVTAPTEKWLLMLRCQKFLEDAAERSAACGA